MKPILFNTEMVQAILDGRKTVTRRLIKPCYRDWAHETGFQIVTNAHTNEFIRVEIVDEWESCTRILPPPYQPGDILYVRETWCKGRVDYGEEPDGRCVPFISQCLGEDDIIPKEWAIRKDIGIEDVVWKPSIHMPKEAARIFLRVTAVRVDRLQNISADQCAMEGVWPLYAGPVGCREAYYKTAFAKLWDSTIKKEALPTYGWGANPYVWTIEFEKISKEEEKC